MNARPSPGDWLRVPTRSEAQEASRRSTGSSAVLVCLAFFALVASPLPYLLRFDHDHYVTAAILILCLTGCAFYSRAGAIAATLLFLSVLGDYRRYAGYLEGYPKNDALLLVAPAVAAILIVQTLLESRRSPRTPLTWLIFALMALMSVEMFNPEQGDLQVGVAGALFYVAPLMWFWVGRAYATPQLARTFTLLLVAVGCAAMALGLYQVRYGLLPFEQQWVEQIGYSALYLADDVIRAIGFFNSSAEYQRYLILATAALAALWFARRSRLALMIPLFLLAIFLSAARGPVVMVLLSVSIVWSLSARRLSMWLPRLLVAAVAGVALLVGLLTVLQNSSAGDRIAPVVERQVSGLLDPTNAEKSTATGHLAMLEEGLLTGITSPAGLGLGATTEAAQKYGSRTLNAEVDIANVMISVGVLGGLLYVSIVAVVLWRSVGWWRRTRSAEALVAVGILFGTLGGWLIGGEYSVAALIWFQIGLMDRLSGPQHGSTAVAHRARHA